MLRSKLILNDGTGCGAVSVSTSVSTPFWLTVTTLQPALPSTSSMIVFLICPRRSGANSGSVETRSDSSETDTPEMAPSCADTWS